MGLFTCLTGAMRFCCASAVVDDSLELRPLAVADRCPLAVRPRPRSPQLSVDRESGLPPGQWAKELHGNVQLSAEVTAVSIECGLVFQQRPPQDSDRVNRARRIEHLL